MPNNTTQISHCMKTYTINILVNYFRSKKFRSGFSLIELSLVILILSILLTIMFGIYYTAADVSGKTSHLIESKKKGIIASEMIRTALNNVYYVSGSERLVFVSRPGKDRNARKDSITFATYHSASEFSGSPAVKEVSFYVQEKGDTFVLMRREDDFVDENPGEGGNHYEILSGVISLEFKFTVDTVKWVDDWNTKKTKHLPRLILIRLVVKDSQGAESVYESVARPGIYLN